MVQLIRAVDVSSHNEPRSREALDAWIANGCQALIVHSYHSGEKAELAQTTREWIEIAHQPDPCWTWPYSWLFRFGNVRTMVRDSIVLYRINGENPKLIGLDCEEFRDAAGNLIDPGPTAEQILIACEQARSMGVEPILYSGLPWLMHMDGDPEILRGIPGWIANYPATTPANPMLDMLHGVPDWIDLHGWQYTSKGPGNADWSVFDLDKLTALANGAQSPGTPTEPPGPVWPPEWPQDAKDTATSLTQTITALTLALGEQRAQLRAASVDYADQLSSQLESIGTMLVSARSVVAQLRELEPPE